jgi:signal transduction histidine kinase/phage shock protein PspC (stress-responsive transcriptional regulator)
MSTPLASPYTPRRAYRSSDDRMLGGVASGLGVHLGVHVSYVRLAFLVCAVFGFGVAFYAALWLVLPTDGHLEHASPGLEAASRQGKRPGRTRRLQDSGPLVALGAVAIGVVVLARSVLGGSMVFWPLLLGLAGLAVLWRQADEAQRERWLDSSGRIDFVRAVVGNGGAASYSRLAAGVGLLVSALVLFAVQSMRSGGSGTFGIAGEVVVAGALGVAGLALMVGPWLFRLTGDLSEERAARVRSQERADMAAHLHDSVLQTLALIQRHAGDSRQVATLARAQERDLRSWLYGEQQPSDTSVAGALRTAAAEVEDSHGVPVEVVVVGDAPLSEPLRPLVLAAREAMVNAARHSGAPQVDVYVECTTGSTEVFVRDRGHGFDERSVPLDRLGVRNSIRDRMHRHGGTAAIRTGPGEGTEVRLAMLTPSSRSEEQPVGDPGGVSTGSTGQDPGSTGPDAGREEEGR